jgi:hypothetical protein
VSPFGCGRNTPCPNPRGEGMSGSRTHGLPCPVLGTNGEVTAVSNHDATRNAASGVPNPLWMATISRPGRSRLRLRAGQPDGPALTALFRPTPTHLYIPPGVVNARPDTKRYPSEATPNMIIDFVEGT